MGRVEGEVAFITGAARGQGRSHALRLAQEGADIIAVDIDEEVQTSPPPPPPPPPLTWPRRSSWSRSWIGGSLPARPTSGPGRAGVGGGRGYRRVRRLDIVCANAGIVGAGGLWELTELQWQEMIDINLTGVWKTTKAAIPSMIEHGNGGSVILTSSDAGLAAFANLGHYVAAKHGVVALMQALAVELAPHKIRCNSVHPATVDTPMLANPAGHQLSTGIEGADRAFAEQNMVGRNAFKKPWVEAIDISNAVLWLASDEARHVTGTTQVVDAGMQFPFKMPHG